MIAAVTSSTGQNQPVHSHLAEYCCEMAGAFFNLFVGLNIVIFDFGKGLPMEQWVPSPSARLLINGIIYAGSGALFAILPWGKLSGAHLNPSVSLAFLLRGKMHLRDFFGYVTFQVFGAIIAAAMTVWLWGKYASSVEDGVTQPGVGFAIWFVFLAEVVMTFLLVLLIFTFVSSERLARWTPCATWIACALMVWQGAPISGTSLNPARSFGPALVSGIWAYQWLYWAAPLLGATLAVLTFRIVASERNILTAKLFHAPEYRSIFKNIHLPHRSAHSPAAV